MHQWSGQGVGTSQPASQQQTVYLNKKQRCEKSALPCEFRRQNNIPRPSYLVAQNIHACLFFKWFFLSKLQVWNLAPLEILSYGYVLSLAIATIRRLDVTASSGISEPYASIRICIHYKYIFNQRGGFHRKSARRDTCIQVGNRNFVDEYIAPYFRTYKNQQVRISALLNALVHGRDRARSGTIIGAWLLPTRLL